MTSLKASNARSSDRAVMRVDIPAAVTSGFGAKKSPPKRAENFQKNWRPQGDSNPCRYRERVMSWASRRWGRIACQRFGGASRDRTGDLYNAIVALSQLSYGPTAGKSESLAAVQL